MLPADGECSSCISLHPENGRRVAGLIIDNSDCGVRRVCDLVQLRGWPGDLANSAVSDLVLAATMASTCVNWRRRYRSNRNL